VVADERAGGMTVHLLKLSVGSADIDSLARFQRRRLRQSMRDGGKPRLWHKTRNTPRRAEELLDGGSIYWVIGGRIRARQRLVGFESEQDPDRGKICLFMLHPELVPTEPWPHRAFQGWRYLEPKDAPPDRPVGATDADMPEAMIAELRELGLL
jgi:hypothetical protein